MVDEGLGLMTAETDYIMKSLTEKCQSIESVILDTADKCKEVVESLANGYTAVSNKASSLIKERKDARRSGDKVQQVASSKLLRKEVRAQLRAFRRGRVSKILLKAKGLQHIASIRQNGRRALLTSVKDISGDIQTSRQGIVDAFASFYELLFTGDVASDCGSAPTEFEGCRGEPITAKEIEGQLKLMKPGKAADGAGVVAEMLKLAGEPTHAVIADLFNEVIQPGGEAPASWRKTRLNVILKKGDPQLLENYRPISILPILLKLFSRAVPSQVGLDRPSWIQIRLLVRRSHVHRDDVVRKEPGVGLTFLGCSGGLQEGVRHGRTYLSFGGLGVSRGAEAVHSCPQESL
jgi:hypothetical protein